MLHGENTAENIHQSGDRRFLHRCVHLLVRGVQRSVVEHPIGGRS